MFVPGFDSEIVSARAKIIAPIAFSISVFLSVAASDGPCCGGGAFLST